jgi:hypothetical protein
MTAGAWTTYNHVSELALKGVDFSAASHFRVVLVDSGYTPDLTHTAWSSISANEKATANGYTANGFGITQTVTRSGAKSTFDSDDPKWTVSGSALAARYAVLVRDANGDGALAAGDYPIAYSLLDATPQDYSVNPGNDFTVQINADGYFSLNKAA